MTRHRLRGIALAVLAALVIHVALVLPHAPDRMGWTALLALPLELPLILLLLTLLPKGRAGRVLRAVLNALLALLVILKLADLTMMQALGRVFDPVVDLPLIDASLRLIAGTFGVPGAILAVIAAIAAIMGIVTALWWASGVWWRMPLPGAGMSFVAMLACVMLIGERGHGATFWPRQGEWPGGAEASQYVLRTVQRTRDTLAGLRQFRQIAAQDALASTPGLLGAIDRDVLVIFVESYGRTSFDTPFHADTHLPTLRAAEPRLAQAGLAMRSGFLTSPTQGGQSWLAHASFATGLWVSDQSRYHAALASPRQGLFHHARAAGFRTAAVMPGVTRAWPESARMGFDTILAASDLGYHGQPFNWVTMPDQFTLAAADRLLRSGANEWPLFAQIALISSHAPWVPVPSLVEWDTISDGRVFDAMASAGDPPAVVWKDRDRVRRHYRASIDYVLRAVTEYALRQAGDPPLMIVLGDHQAAASIALDERRQVPVHVIGPAALVDRTADWGLTPGLIPAADAELIPMEAMRDLILTGFAASAAPS